MKNKEIAHLWAHGTHSSGHGSHFHFEGAVIYSYGAHFPIARLFPHPVTGKRCVLFTSRGYSFSTARHKSYVRSASCHLDTYEVEDVMRQATDKRAMRKLEMEKAQRETESAAARLKEDQRRAIRAGRLLARSPEILSEWINGTRESLPRSLSLGVILRARDGQMETSKGAKVPLADAERTLRFTSALRARGWHKNGERHAIGHYEVDAVNGYGVIAGCHHVSWAEIDRFAASQGWTTSAAI